MVTMSPSPDFDYYAALEIEKSATAQEITTSYRRLARIHHPDKNLQNAEATAKFQRIQHAYDTLGDETKRRQHDARSSGRSSPAQTSNSRPSHGTFNGGHREDSNESKWFTPQRDFAFYDFFGHIFGTRDSFFDAHLEREAFAQKQRAESAMAETEMCAKAEEAKREAKAKAKRDVEAEDAKSKEQLHEGERAHQEKYWVEHGITDPDVKLTTCLHSAFMPRENKLQWKFKCHQCEQKRGPTGFRCPHCDLVFCQACLKEVTSLRGAAETL